MNTLLTKNRILEAGDEYRSNGEWKAVPDIDLGLQIMFTNYAEVRRPSEELPQRPGDSGEPSQDGIEETPLAQTKNLSGNCLTPQVGKDRGEIPSAAQPISPDNPLTGKHQRPAHISVENKTAYLPKVISKNAHALENDAGKIAAEIAKIIAPVAPPITPDSIQIKFPIYPESTNPPECIWTGRNGTFKGKAIELNVCEGDTIQMSPIGMRGKLGNCLIEFPASIIPQLTDWLLKHQPAKTT